MILCGGGLLILVLFVLASCRLSARSDAAMERQWARRERSEYDAMQAQIDNQSEQITSLMGECRQLRAARDELAALHRADRAKQQAQVKNLQADAFETRRTLRAAEILLRKHGLQLYLCNVNALLAEDEQRGGDE